MNIFYRNSTGRADVPEPASLDLATTVAVFRGLEPKHGFMGIKLDERHVLQLKACKGGQIEVELLDTSIPAFDSCETGREFAETLIHAAFNGQDVFKMARAANQWEHWDLSQSAQSEITTPIVQPFRVNSERSGCHAGETIAYRLKSIKSGNDHLVGIWVSIGFSSAGREFDVLHIVGGEETDVPRKAMGLMPIYLERHDQSFSCYQGVNKILVASDSITVHLNLIGQDALDLPETLHFTSEPDDAFRQAKAVFNQMKAFDSGKLIEWV